MGFLKKFLSNCACPKGTLGRVMLHGMTFGHRWIADWGLKHLDGVSAASIVELGCGAVRTPLSCWKNSPRRV